VGGKTLEEDLRRYFEGQPCHRVANGVELALSNTFSGFQLSQHLFLCVNVDREFGDAGLKLFDRHIAPL